jgi:hypothetical protein
MTISPETISLVLRDIDCYINQTNQQGRINIYMDIAILLGHLFASLLYLSFSIPQSVLIVVYTALWYMFIDRGVINILLLIPVRFLLVLFNVKDKVTVGTFWVEIIKAPLSAGLGGYILLLLFKTSSIYIPFGIGILLWSLNFHFIGGIFKNHPLRVVMYVCVFLLTIITVGLLPEYK